MNTRLTALMTTLAMMVLITGAAYAQESSDYCLGLSEDDCTLYYEWVETNTVSSASFDANLAFEQLQSFEGEAEPITIAMDADMSGAFLVDPTAYEEFATNAASLPLRDLSLGLAYDWLDARVSSFNASLEASVSLEYAGSPVIPGGTADVRLFFVDGVGYVDLSPVAALLGNPELEGTFGLDVMRIGSFGLDSVTVGDLFPGGGMDGDLSDFDMDGGAEMLTDEDIAEILGTADEIYAQAREIGEAQLRLVQAQQAFALMSEETVATFATIERLADETIDGETVAVFRTDINWSALASLPEFQNAVRANLAVQAYTNPGIQELDIEGLLTALVEDMTFNELYVIERFGVEDGYLYGFEIFQDLNIDAASFVLNITGIDTDEAPLIEQSFAFTLERGDFDAVEAIELPEDAQVVPLFELISLAGEM